MKLTLVFPPPFDLSQPYLSLPMLSGFLKQHGHEAIQRDVNVELYDHLVTQKTIEAAYNLICSQLNFGVSCESGSQANSRALERARRIAPWLIKLSSSIKAGFREAGPFFNPALYSRNIRLLGRVCEVIAAAYNPTSLSPISYGMKYRTSYVYELLEAICDERQNLFIKYFRDVFVPSLLADGTMIFGISVVYTDQMIPTLTLARLLKAANPQAVVIIGGDVFSRMARTSVGGLDPLHDVVDAFVIDDGREPLLAICNRLSTGGSLDSIPRVVTRQTTSTDPIHLLAEQLQEQSFVSLPVRTVWG